jgi:hypothetical protein
MSLHVRYFYVLLSIKPHSSSIELMLSYVLTFLEAFSNDYYGFMLD